MYLAQVPYHRLNNFTPLEVANLLEQVVMLLNLPVRTPKTSGKPFCFKHTAKERKKLTSIIGRGHFGQQNRHLDLQ